MWACLICLHPTPHLAKRGATFVLGEQRAASNDAFPSFLGLVLGLVHPLLTIFSSRSGPVSVLAFGFRFSGLKARLLGI
jgi:hypothetical protein